MFRVYPSLQKDILIASAVALISIGSAPAAATDEPASPKENGEASVVKPQFVPGDIDTLPRIRFADGQVSLNDRCPVRKGPLNLRMPPVYVNGRPVGFC